MNRESIFKTTICYWSEEDDCYVVVSPLFQRIAGVGQTPKKALDLFQRLLDDAYMAYLEGRVPGYERAGRPAKGLVTFNSYVQPETKENLKKLAKSFDCSQGEVVDYLMFFHQVRNESLPGTRAQTTSRAAAHRMRKKAN